MFSRQEQTKNIEDFYFVHDLEIKKNEINHSQ